MTKQEVLQDIDRLCGEIDKWTWELVRAKKERDLEVIRTCSFEADNLIVAAHQELSFLRDYIDDNVKED